MRATVVITTKNRCEDLRRAIASALAQTSQPEILVVDDGSTDGTWEAVTREFPSARLHRSEQSLGLIVQRNRAARLASAPILFSLDDDAVFSTPRIVEATLGKFDHPRIGAVAIPFVDVNRGPAVHQQAPQREQVFATYDYIGTAHALRRDLFLELGGYREVLFHQGEEEDYCIRMLNAGFITRAGSADPIHHFESPRRNWARMDFYGARNKVLYAWQNVPHPYLMPHLAVGSVMTSLYTRNPRRMLTRWRGVLIAYFLIAAGQCHRQPVDGRTYRVSRMLKRRRFVPFSEFQTMLPELSIPGGDAPKVCVGA